MYWHDRALEDIDAIKKANPVIAIDLAEVMQDKWQEEHDHYVEKASKFKRLLEVYKET